MAFVQQMHLQHPTIRYSCYDVRGSTVHRVRVCDCALKGDYLGVTAAHRKRSKSSANRLMAMLSSTRDSGVSPSVDLHLLHLGDVAWSRL